MPGTTVPNFTPIRQKIKSGHSFNCSKYNHFYSIFAPFISLISIISIISIIIYSEFLFCFSPKIIIIQSFNEHAQKFFPLPIDGSTVVLGTRIIDIIMLITFEPLVIFR